MSGIFSLYQRLMYVQTNCRPARKGGNSLTKEKLGALIIDSERHMYVTARSILPEDEDCADAIQETIVKAFSKINSLKQDAYAKTWLIRILINECYNVLRQKSRQIPIMCGSLKSCCSRPEWRQSEDIINAFWRGCPGWQIWRRYLRMS